MSTQLKIRFKSKNHKTLISFIEDDLMPLSNRPTIGKLVSKLKSEIDFSLKHEEALYLTNIQRHDIREHLKLKIDRVAKPKNDFDLLKDFTKCKLELNSLDQYIDLYNTLLPKKDKKHKLHNVKLTKLSKLIENAKVGYSALDKSIYKISIFNDNNLGFKHDLLSNLSLINRKDYEHIFNYEEFKEKLTNYDTLSEELMDLFSYIDKQRSVIIN